METSRRNFLTAAAAMAATATTAPLASAADKFARDRDWTGESPVTYPEPAWEVRDKRFTGMQGNATLQRIWHGMGNDRALWCEGPVWMGDWGSLIWSDIPNHRTLRWIEDDSHVSVFQTESGFRADRGPQRPQPAGHLSRPERNGGCRAGVGRAASSLGSAKRRRARPCFYGHRPSARGRNHHPTEHNALCLSSTHDQHT